MGDLRIKPKTQESGTPQLWGGAPEPPERPVEGQRSAAEPGQAGVLLPGEARTGKALGPRAASASAFVKGAEMVKKGHLCPQQQKGRA